MSEFQTNRGNGRFNFASNITNNPANNTGGHVMAAFLLGAPSLIEQDYLLADAAIRTTEYGLYVADDWRATSTLTLNLGLRYELDTPPSETSNQWANFDPTTATVLVAGRNGVSETAGVNTFKRAFAPRLGFAYQLAQHTVVRGGAGTALVGDPETVAARMKEYMALGIDTFILSGYPHLEEAYIFGEGVRPILAERGLLDDSARLARPAEPVRSAFLRTP